VNRSNRDPRPAHDEFVQLPLRDDVFDERRVPVGKQGEDLFVAQGGRRHPLHGKLRVSDRQFRAIGIEISAPGAERLHAGGGLARRLDAVDQLLLPAAVLVRHPFLGGHAAGAQDVEQRSPFRFFRGGQRLIRFFILDQHVHQVVIRHDPFGEKRLLLPFRAAHLRPLVFGQLQGSVERAIGLRAHAERALCAFGDDGDVELDPELRVPQQIGGLFRHAERFAIAVLLEAQLTEGGQGDGAEPPLLQIPAPGDAVLKVVLGAFEIAFLDPVAGPLIEDFADRVDDLDLFRYCESLFRGAKEGRSAPEMVLTERELLQIDGDRVAEVKGACKRDRLFVMRGGELVVIDDEVGVGDGVLRAQERDLVARLPRDLPGQKGRLQGAAVIAVGVVIEAEDSGGQRHGGAVFHVVAQRQDLIEVLLVRHRILELFGAAESQERLGHDVRVARLLRQGETFLCALKGERHVGDRLAAEHDAFDAGGERQAGGVVEVRSDRGGEPQQRPRGVEVLTVRGVQRARRERAAE